jgi:hypothetical protein
MKERDFYKISDFWKILDNVIYQSDVLLEVADARMPDLTRNKKLENIIQRKRKTFILVLNKSDLITKKMRDDFLKNSRLRKVVFVSCKKRADIIALKKMIFNLSRNKPHWDKIRVGVVGYPNTGKSSIINSLTGRSAAKTSPIAGLTRGIQWVRGKSNLMFLDSPGVIPLYEKDEAEQALMSAIDPDKLQDPGMAAMMIIQLFLDNNRKNLEKFYGVKVETDDTLEILLEIGKKRNFLWKGGKIDERRTALTIIKDWQRGNLLLNFMAS